MNEKLFKKSCKSLVDNSQHYLCLEQKYIIKKAIDEARYPLEAFLNATILLNIFIKQNNNQYF